MTLAPELKFSLLDEGLIRYRTVAQGDTVFASLPRLMVALAADEVRDFPALRPHQRHPWHAFLVQLAAIALHRAGRLEPFGSEGEWRSALMALTPDDADGAAWCLVSPTNRPAFLQAPTAGWSPEDWDTVFAAADQLDMLATSKGHDLKSARMQTAAPEDWAFALVSLQTQAGSNSPKHRGVSRMNSGDGSRPGVGIAPKGGVGSRWKRDVRLLVGARSKTVEMNGLKLEDGLALVWLKPWDGQARLSFAELDPYFIEICRRVRLLFEQGQLLARRAQSPVQRILAEARRGATGDPWVPVNISDPAGAKALTIGSGGFHYKLVAELLFGVEGTFRSPIAQDISRDGSEGGLTFVARGIARGKDKTDGFHERRVPISPKVRGFLVGTQSGLLGRLAGQRLAAIGDLRELLISSLRILFNNGVVERKYASAVDDKAKRFARPFERSEDARFFDDLNDEVEADDPNAQRLQWLQGLVERAAALLKVAFDAGPRSAIQRYRAQAAALSRFHGALRGEKSPLPELAHHYRQQSQTHQQQEETRDHA